MYNEGSYIYRETAQGIYRKTEKKAINCKEINIFIFDAFDAPLKSIKTILVLYHTLL